MAFSLFQNRSLSKENLTQATSIIIVAFTWFLFISSTVNYTHFSWHGWLLFSRVVAGCFGLLIAMVVILRDPPEVNLDTWYFVISLAIQASHGALEPSNQSEFYNFTGLFFILSALSYRGTFSRWVSRHFPFQLLIMICPLFFKDMDYLFPIAKFIDNFSLAIAGVLIGTVIARINSTKHMALQENLNLKERLLSEQQSLFELATQVAHDIRSPLTALEVVIGDLNDFQEQKYKVVRSSLNRIKEIANTLLDRRRVSKSSPPSIWKFEAHVYSLRSLLVPIVSEKTAQFRSKPGVQISLQFNLPEDEDFVRVPATQLRRVLSNLLNNAVESISSTGTVVISVDSEGSYINIKIRDNGVGIESSLIPMLLNTNASVGKENGNGLGLAKSKKLVEGWGATFDLSSSPGEGTTVSIRFTKESTPSWLLRRLNIPNEAIVVILDNDHSIPELWRLRLKDDLAHKKTQILSFSDINSIRKWVANGNLKPERRLVFLFDYDLGTKNQNGLTLAKELGVESSTILVTGLWDAPEVQTACRKWGVPLMPKELIHNVPIGIG